MPGGGAWGIWGRILRVQGQRQGTRPRVGYEVALRPNRDQRFGSGGRRSRVREQRFGSWPEGAGSRFQVWCLRLKGGNGGAESQGLVRGVGGWGRRLSSLLH